MSINISSNNFFKSSTFSGGRKNSITINGKTIQANGDITVINDKVYVDGKELKHEELESKVVNITIVGVVQKVDGCNEITVQGNVDGDLACGKATIYGDVLGNISAGKVKFK